MTPRMVPTSVLEFARSLVSLAVAGGLCLAFGFATTTQSGQEEGEQPQESGLVEEVDVRLVEQRIVAMDRKGNPVSGLTVDDFEVRDRSGNTTIAYVRPFRESYDEKPEELPEASMFVQAPGGWPGEKSSRNRPERYVALFIDVENDPKLLRPEATGDLVRFIREQLVPGDRVAVFSYDGDLHQDLPFTADHESVINAAMQAFNRTPRPRLTVKNRIEELIRNFEECVIESGVAVRRADEWCVRDIVRNYTDERNYPARDYLDALQGLVRLLGGLDADKTVLALSHGVAASPQAEIMEALYAVLGNTDQVAGMTMHMMVGEGLLHELDRVIEDALRQKVVLSFIDRSVAPADTSISASRSAALMPGATPVLAAFEAPRSDLRKVAGSTGGVFIGESDLYEGLTEALDLERGTYVLGYYVDKPLHPNELAKVKIECKRKGVRLSYRRGYYAKPSVQRINGGLKLGRARPTESSPGESDKPRVYMPFALELDPQYMGYQDAGQEVVTNFSLHVQLYTDKGTPLVDSYHFVNHAFPAKLYREVKTEPVTITGWLRLTEGRYRLRALVRNPRMDYEGSFEKTILVAGVADQGQDSAPGEEEVQPEASEGGATEE